MPPDIGCQLDVLEPDLAHDVGDPVRVGIALHAADEIAVRAALAGDATDDRHDPVEPELEDPGEPAPGPGDLEADHPPTRPDRAGHLGEALAVVGQVAHPERDRRGVERAVLGRQREGVADDELEARPVGEPALRATRIIAGEMSTPRTLPPGWHARWRSAATLPVPVATSRSRSPGRAPVSFTARFRQRGSWNAEMTRFIGS